MKIKSYWQYEKGKWDESKGKFINKYKTEIQEKILQVEIFKGTDGIMKISFKGGPTGYETYYLEDILKTDFSYSENIYICAGTINSWSKCWVKSRDLQVLLYENKYLDTII